jgi:membrane associated rhomboid family serine protease
MFGNLSGCKPKPFCNTEGCVAKPTNARSFKRGKASSKRAAYLENAHKLASLSGSQPVQSPEVDFEATGNDKPDRVPKRERASAAIYATSALDQANDGGSEDIDQVLNDLESDNPIPADSLSITLEGYQIPATQLEADGQSTGQWDPEIEAHHGSDASDMAYYEQQQYDQQQYDQQEYDHHHQQQQEEQQKQLQQRHAQQQRAAKPRPKRRAYFTIVMILVNVIAFVMTLWKADWKIQDTKLNPMIGPDGAVLTEMGAKVAPLIIEGGEWWRLFSAMILHAGAVHLFFNMYSFWGLGKPLEEEFGWKTVSFIYIVSGFTGNAASAIFLPVQITVGASGAIFGLFGAVWADFIQNCRQYKGQRTKTLCKLLLMSVVSLAIGLMPLVDNFAHVGGFVGGLLCGLFLVMEDSQKSLQKAREAIRRSNSFRGGGVADSEKRPCCTWECFHHTFVGGAGFIMLLIYILSMCVILFTDEVSNPNGWCNWCTKINCLETSLWDCQANDLSSCIGVQIYTSPTPGDMTIEMVCSDGVRVSNIDGSKCMADPVCFSDVSIECQWTKCACSDYCSFGANSTGA